MVLVVVISLISLNKFYSLDAFRFSQVGIMMTLEARTNKILMKISKDMVGNVLVKISKAKMMKVSITNHSKVIEAVAGYFT